MYGPALGLRPYEAAAFQSLGEKAQTIAVPPQQLYDVPSAPAEHEHVPGERLLLEYSLHLCTQSIETAAHIGHSGRKPDLGAIWKLDHVRRLSRICRTNTESAPLSTLIMAIPGSSM